MQYIATEKRNFYRKYRDSKYLNVDASGFENFSTKYHVYILGLLWADGFVTSKNKSKQIKIESVEEDLQQLKSIFDETGKWSVYKRQRSNRKPQMSFICNNARLIDFLCKYNYKEKSLMSPTILQQIPENMKKYFLRGMIDGDGCFYISKDNKTNQFCLAGSYDQDWSDITKILEMNNIKYKICRRIHHKQHGKINKSSSIRITNRHMIKYMSKLIYDNEYDGIGLKRKYDKCQQIIRNCQ